MLVRIQYLTLHWVKPRDRPEHCQVWPKSVSISSSLSLYIHIHIYISLAHIQTSRHRDITAFHWYLNKPQKQNRRTKLKGFLRRTSRSLFYKNIWICYYKTHLHRKSLSLISTDLQVNIKIHFDFSSNKADPTRSHSIKFLLSYSSSPISTETTASIKRPSVHFRKYAM